VVIVKNNKAFGKLWQNSNLRTWQKGTVPTTILLLMITNFLL